MKKFFLAIFLATAVFCSLNPSPLLAEEYTYTVQEGDTLWNICEKVYGDADLWPKLWQMNPFITNPHLLKPGDVVKLFEAPSASDKGAAQASAPPPPKDDRGLEAGLDVSPFTEVASAGFLSRNGVQPWGRILRGETDRTMLSEGDVIFVQMEDGFRSDPGKLYTVYELSPPQKDPLDGGPIGCVVTYAGKISVKEHVRDLLYKAEVAESYRTISPGDLIIPNEPISPCVRFLPSDPGLVSHVGAVKDQLKLIGQYTVVYLPVGYEEGVRRGNLFEIFEKPASLPERVLGHLLILEARPDTATAVVIDVKENVAPGVSVRGFNWVEAPEFLPALQRCGLE